MKKILFLLAMLPMMIACSSSDDEPKDSLVGTIWQSYEKWEDLEALREITFTTSSKCSVRVEEKTDGVTDYSSSGIGSYEYSSGAIIIKWQDGYTESGTISGNTMKLTDEDGYSETFIKK